MINYNTKNFVVVNFPANSGGKLLANVLAIGKNFLHQHDNFAKLKIENQWSEKKSFEISRSVYEHKIKISAHFELDTYKLAGFNYDINNLDQEYLATELWKKLTHQDQYYFVAINHNPYNSWQHYPLAKHIITENFEFVLSKRDIILEKKWHFDFASCKNFTKFNMESIHKKESFQKEIDKICEYVGITIKNKKYINFIRESFLKTVMLGYK